MTACAYCGCTVEAHDPVHVDDGGETYHFCNWACLREHVDAAGLAEGARCRLDRPTDA